MSTEDFIKDVEPFLHGKPLTYIDAGAHHGDVFAAFARSALNIREAHLFEPNPASFAKLQATTNNSAFAKIKPLKCYNLALSNSASPVLLRPAGTMTRVLVDAIDGDDLIHAQSTTLDEVAKQFTTAENIILKIDVEGHEASVLKGAERLLESQKIHLIHIEVGFDPDNHQQAHYRAIEDALARFKYRIFKIYEQKNEWLQDSPLLRRANFAFMSQAFAQRTPFKLSHDFYQLSKRHKQTARELEHAQNTLQKLTQETEQHKSALDKLQAESKAAGQRATSSARDAEMSLARIVALEQAQEAESALRTALEQRARELEHLRTSDASAAEARINGLHQQIATLQSTVDELAKHKEAADQRVAELEHLRTSDATAADASINGLHQQIASLESAASELAKLKRTAALQATELTAKAADSEMLREQLAKARRSIDGLRDDLNKARAQTREEAARARATADRIKRHLSYRLGAEIVNGSESVRGILGLPIALRRAYKAFLADRAATQAPQIPATPSSLRRITAPTIKLDTQDGTAALSATSAEQSNGAKYQPTREKVIELGRNIFGAFPDQARIDLEKIIHSTSHSREIRTIAAASYGRWLFTYGEHTKALNIVSQGTIDADLPKATIKTLGILKTLCELHLGQVAPARATVQNLARRIGDDVDTNLLAAAVIRETAIAEGVAATAVDDKYLIALNVAFESAGLATVRKRNAAEPLDLGNITASTKSSLADQSEKVSVIIPAFNAEDKIGWVLDSLGEQTYRNIEVIVVDDCSTDATASIVRAYRERDPRIRLVRREQNGGAYPARNDGLAVATGDLLMVHDSDDWSHPQKIERQIQALRSKPRCVAVMSHWLRVGEGVKVVGTWRPKNSLIDLNFSSLMFRRIVMETLGGWDEVRISGDAEFRSRILIVFGQNSIHKMRHSEILSLSLAHNESLTRAKSTHLRSLDYGLRWQYRDAYLKWHSDLKKGIGSPKLKRGTRRFPAPLSVLPERNTKITFDVIFLSDFAERSEYFLADRRSIEMAHKSGLKIGISHLRTYGLSLEAPLRPEIYELCASHNVELLTAGDKALAKTFVVCTPHILQYKPDPFLQIECEEVIVIEGVSALSIAPSTTRSYDTTRVSKHVRELFGKEAQWYKTDNTLDLCSRTSAGNSDSTRDESLARLN